MLATTAPRTPRLDRSGVRFNISHRGSRKVIEHQNRRQYRELLRHTPQWSAELQVELDQDDDWIIVGILPPALTHGQYSLEKNTLGNGYCWGDEQEARQYLDEHEDELRIELTEDLFTMGLCSQCESVVPVFGDYVPFAPAGLLYCGDCLSDDKDEPAAPAILHS